MDDRKLQELATWITEAGLVGGSQTDMVAGFCERALAAELPLGSLIVVVDTLHPTHEGHAVKWRRNTPEAAFIEYGRTNRGGEAAGGAARSMSCSIPARPICGCR